MTELQEHLAQDPEGFAFEEPWRIDGFATCQWALRKLKLAQERLDDIDQQASDEVSKIADWRERVSKSAKRDETYFTNALRDYMLRVREETGEKSLVLPEGEIQSRAIGEKALVQDKELFLKWAENNERGQWIRTKLEVALDVLKDEVEFDGESVIDKVTGEIVEGLVCIESEISVSVKVSK